MKHLLRVGMAVLLGLLATPIAEADYQPLPGAYAVNSIRCDWTDASRNREMPVKIYFPKTGGGPFPVIIFSHGLGGSREGYEYLGEYWASHGYVSVHLQHIGSDKDEKSQPMICAGTTAFWDAHLRGDAEAKSWLERGGFAGFIGGDGMFEIK